MPHLIFIGQKNYFGAHVDTSHGCTVVFRDWAVNRDSPDNLRGLSADLILCFRGELIPGDVVRSWRGKKVLLSTEPMPYLTAEGVLITTDRAHRFAELSRARGFDHIYHFDPMSISYLRRMGLPVADEPFYLPVNCRLFRARRPRQPRWKVMLLGKQTSYRDYLIAPLKHLYGDEFLHVAHGYNPKEIAQAASESALALNLHADDMPSLEPRLSILMANSIPVISERLSSDKLFKPGQHYIEAPAEDLGRIIAYYLAHPGEAEIIGQNGYHLVSNNLDAKLYWQSFAEKLLGGGGGT